MWEILSVCMYLFAFEYAVPLNSENGPKPGYATFEPNVILILTILRETNLVCRPRMNRCVFYSNCYYSEQFTCYRYDITQSVMAGNDLLVTGSNEPYLM